MEGPPLELLCFNALSISQSIPIYPQNNVPNVLQSNSCFHPITLGNQYTFDKLESFCII
jgi:hypothetical protein